MKEHVDHAREAMRAIDHALAQQDADFERLEREAEARGLSHDETNRVYWDWIHKITHEPVTEANVTIEGSPHIVLHDPNQGTLWD